MRIIALVALMAATLAGCGGTDARCDPDPAGFRCYGNLTPYLGQDDAGDLQWMGGYAHGCVRAVNQPSRDYVLWVCGN